MYRRVVKQKLCYIEDAQLLALIFNKCKFKGLPDPVDSKTLAPTSPSELTTYYIPCSKKCEKSTSCEHSLHHSVLNGHFYEDLQKNPRIIIHFFKRCLKCVLFLNTNGIIHSDISPSNIVVKANMPFLVDFEDARAIKLGESDILELKHSINFIDENVEPKKVHKRDELFTSYLYSDVSGYDLDRQCLGAVFQFILVGTTTFFSQDRQKPVEELLSLNSLDEKKEYLRRNLNPIFKKIKFIDKIIEITAQMCTPVYKLEVKEGKTRQKALEEAKNQALAKKNLLKKQIRKLVCLDLSTSVSNEHFSRKLASLKK